MTKVRVRYAPSPTGHLHIGNARTALFNYLFARHNDGEFIIRIEDTDQKRNIEDGEKSQLENLAWLGMEWDESPAHPGEYGPYRQSERKEIYQPLIDQLLSSNRAYKCYCTPEELEAEREAQQARGEMPHYAGTCANLTPSEQAAKEAGNMIDLDSSPTKLLQVVQIGKQLLMTRGALTTFSIANDIAKYFAVIPVLFYAIYPELAALNIMNLGSPLTAILSAVIYNAVVIIALIPLALKGVKYQEKPASQMLRHNLVVYGLGGIIAPFICIKLVDLLLSAVLL